MTVLIAAEGEPGEAAVRALQERDVVRVETAGDALDELDDATVVALGDLADGSPDDVRTEARAADVPVVELADHPSGSPETMESFREAVDLAHRVVEYRDAVDEFYERCRAHAENNADTDLQTASNRAHSRFCDLREAAGYTPYERVLEQSPEVDGEDDTGSGSDTDST